MNDNGVMSHKAVTEFVKSQFVLSTDADIEQMIADGSWVEGQFYYTAE